MANTPDEELVTRVETLKPLRNIEEDSKKAYVEPVFKITDFDLISSFERKSIDDTARQMGYDKAYVTKRLNEYLYSQETDERLKRLNNLFELVEDGDEVEDASVHEINPNVPDIVREVDEDANQDRLFQQKKREYQRDSEEGEKLFLAQLLDTYSKDEIIKRCDVTHVHLNNTIKWYLELHQSLKRTVNQEEENNHQHHSPQPMGGPIANATPELLSDPPLPQPQLQQPQQPQNRKGKPRQRDKTNKRKGKAL